MKATILNKDKGLKSQAKLYRTANGVGSATGGFDDDHLTATKQGFLPLQRRLALASQFRLRAGDVVRFQDKPCLVIRVSESAAVIAVRQPAREFTTLFGKLVRIRPKPRLIRISANSEVQILNRKRKGARK